MGMLEGINWDNYKAEEGFNNPKPGAYIARIVYVEDEESKEYIRIKWDFADGPYKGANKNTFDRAGFWPTEIFRSYKEKSRGMFKWFFNILEQSNRGYKFDPRNLNGMAGLYLGVVLGEEGYYNKKGEHKKRLYVDKVKTIEDIQRGNFHIPEYREKDAPPDGQWDAQASSGWDNDPPPSSSGSFDYQDGGRMPWDN